ncbi:MAG: AMIN domain-containing protein, partial [Cyanobacteria bacterium P01_H01_bin.21]
MMSKRLQRWNQVIVLAVAGGLVMPAQAQESSREWMGERGNAANWLAQTPLMQITAVWLDTTETGLQILLETTESELAVPTTTVSGNVLIAEIPNAVLALPGGTEFQRVEPAAGIAQVQVIGLSDNRVRVVVTGAEVVPMAAVNVGVNGLMLSVTPGTAQVDDSDESLRILVTGEEGSRYVEPTATTATRTDTPLRD